MIHLSPHQARALERQAGLPDFRRVAHLVRELRPLWPGFTEVQRRELLRRLEDTPEARCWVTQET